MSIRIEINTITRLLLQGGVWYEVLPGSVTIDLFEWTKSEGLVIDDGDIVADVPTMGVRFKARGMNGWISCPLRSIVSVHCEPSEIDEPTAINIPEALADEV